MLNLTRIFFALGLTLALVGSDTSTAQGPGPDVKRLETDLEKLRDQVKDAEAKLAKAKEMAARKGPFEGKGKGFGKGDFFKKKDGPKGEAGRPGFPPFGEKKGFGKMSPEMIKVKYEFYKRLYEDSKKESAKPAGPPFGKGFGPKGFFEAKKKGLAPAERGKASIEARIDQLIRELEELRAEVKKK